MQNNQMNVYVMLQVESVFKEDFGRSRNHYSAITRAIALARTRQERHNECSME